MNQQALTTTTTIHDSHRCTEGPDGSECDQCAAANEYEARIATSRAKIALPPRVEHLRCGECGEFEPCSCASPFNAVWDTAPRERRRLVEREDAEYWFLRGRQWGMAEALAQSNADLKQLIKENDDESRNH